MRDSKEWNGARALSLFDSSELTKDRLRERKVLVPGAKLLDDLLSVSKGGGESMRTRLKEGMNESLVGQGYEYCSRIAQAAGVLAVCTSRVEWNFV